MAYPTTDAFDPGLTHDDIFYLPKAVQTSCRMMARPDEEELVEFEYFADDDLQLGG